jgi:cytidylate kinase
MAGGSSTPGIRSIFAATKVTPLTLKHHYGDAPPVPRPFVTISREAGAGGRTIGSLLVTRLNELDLGEPPWSLWDKDLVEKVAQEHHISKELIESLESSHKPWMQEFLSTLSMQVDPDDVRIYRMVAATIRALAQRGRVVVVGRGGAFITRQMPGGIHLRLIAPRDFRVAAMAEQLKLTREAAGEHVRQLDHQRDMFYKRYWPKDACTPDAFTLTINTANTDERRVVECILPLVLAQARVTVRQSTTEVFETGE